MKNNLCLAYLSNLLPATWPIAYSLRNVENIPLKHARTQLYSESFLPSAIRDWNNLPLESRNSTTLESFKSSLNKQQQKVPRYYYTGSRKGQILHTRLRLSCSSLNHDLFKCSLTETPNCACGSVETASHFLLYCPIYDRERRRFLLDLPCAPTINNYLYGNESLTEDQNKHVFLQVQRFIIATNRF